MRKRNLWTWLAGGMAVAALIVGSTWAWHSAQAQPWGGHHGMMGLRGMLHELDLTADQKKQLGAILRAHKSELLQARERMGQAGRAVMEGLADQDVRPEALQAKVDAAAEAGKQLGKVLIGIRQETMGVLTAQQKQDLAKRQQRFIQRIEKHMNENRQDREHDLDEWIDRLSNAK